MILREERIGNQRLILGDCIAVMPTLGRFDALVTSPPYDDIRDYGPGYKGVDLLAVIAEISRHLETGGVCMWNVADATVNGSETGSSFRQALHAMECGMRLHDTMIYCKEGVTFPHNNRYHPAFEYMFVFSNGAPKSFNGVKDWRNKWAGSKMHGTDRLKDGSTKQTNGKGNPVPEMGLRRNWWVMSNPYTGQTGNHPAPMPYNMAADHITSWTNCGDTVLDPFLGSGTTLVACQRMGRHGTGIEIDKDYWEIACRRVEEAARQPDLFIRQDKPDAKPPLLPGM